MKNWNPINRLDLNGPKCKSCGYVRTEKDTGRRHRCPKCNATYISTGLKKIREAKYERYADYQANHIPVRERITNIVLFLGLSYVAYISLLKGEIETITLGTFIPVVKLSGGGVIWGFLCIIFCSTPMLLMVVDHYDKRDNEHIYAFMNNIKAGQSGVGPR